MKKIYSPIQIGLGSILGGPIASLYFLKKNFDQLNKQNYSKLITIFGLVIMILLPISMAFFDRLSPFINIPISILAMMFSNKFQMKTSEIKNSEHYQVESYIKLVGLSILLAVITFFLGIVIILFLPNEVISWIVSQRNI